MFCLKLCDCFYTEELGFKFSQFLNKESNNNLTAVNEGRNQRNVTLLPFCNPKVSISYNPDWIEILLLSRIKGCISSSNLKFNRFCIEFLALSKQAYIIR